MICLTKKSLLILGFAVVSFAFVSARTVSECKIQLKEIAQELIDKNACNSEIPSISITSLIPKISSLSEENLIDLCDRMLFYRKDLGSRASDVEVIKDELIRYLKSFVAKGMDIGEFDANFALFYDEQDPDFVVEFVNPSGEVKTRKYALNIWSYGLKFEFAIKSFGIAIIGNSFNYYDTNKEFNLGSGIDLGLKTPQAPLVGCSFVLTKIQETGCGLFLIGVAVGIGGGVSYVSGGKMTPVNA